MKRAMNMKCFITFMLLFDMSLWINGNRFHVDLHKHGLKTVPSGIPSSTESLDLSSNLLKIITNDSFITLSSLTQLDLSGNQIERLEPSAFTGLSQLAFLTLGANKLLLNYEAYPVTVFEPLIKLTVLDLEKNMRNTSPPDRTKIREYPEKIFSSLNYLTTLSIDGLKDVRFGSGFLRMSHLNSLTIYYGELGAVLKLDTIAVFVSISIKTLFLYCYNIEEGILKPFKSLTNIFLSTDSLDHSLELLSGIRNRTMTSVSIDESNPGQFLRTNLSPGNLVLTKNNTAHLATICVKYLSLKKNFIIHLGADVLLSFQHPECLEILDLQGNPLNLATHLVTFLSMARFPNLKYINLSPARRLSRIKRDTLSHKSEKDQQPRKHKKVLVPLPPSIEVLNVSYISGKNHPIPDVEFQNGHHLHTLDFAYFGIQDCSFRLSGLSNLTVLNISGFDCSGSPPELLKSLSQLEVLTARDCKLDESLEHDPNGQTFLSLVRLRTLDLSDNNFITIHKRLFEPLVNLEVLIMANNKLFQIPETISTLRSLSHLDLSSNVLVSVSPKEVEWLIDIQSRDKNKLSLYLSHNPLLCTCKTIKFLQWYFSTNIHINDDLTLTCTLENGTVTKIRNLKSQINNMKVKCVSKFWLTFSVVGSCLFTISIILGIFGYRYRWNIKYWILTKCRRGPVYEELAVEQYQFDAFVAYNYQNYQWACIVLRNVLETENTYSLCLHDRDFPVGVSIQQNIVDAVNNSRKVILVINRAFLTSDWCEFEIQMAGMRMVRDGRENAIIVIMMEEIPMAEMPRSLLNLWKHITFLLWNNDQTDERIFWNRLLEVMERP